MASQKGGQCASPQHFCEIQGPPQIPPTPGPSGTDNPKISQGNEALWHSNATALASHGTEKDLLLPHVLWEIVVLSQDDFQHIFLGTGIRLRVGNSKQALDPLYAGWVLSMLIWIHVYDGLFKFIPCVLNQHVMKYHCVSDLPNSPPWHQSQRNSWNGRWGLPNGRFWHHSHWIPPSTYLFWTTLLCCRNAGYN